MTNHFLLLYFDRVNFLLLLRAFKIIEISLLSVPNLKKEVLDKLKKALQETPTNCEIMLPCKCFAALIDTIYISYYITLRPMFHEITSKTTLQHSQNFRCEELDEFY